jgi:WD40 repeat protein
MRPRCRPLALLACLASMLSASGYPAAPPGRLRSTDLYGDPLPAGARARLGTLRFRTREPFTPLRFTFTPDGRALVWGDGNDLVLWDMDAGRPIRRLVGHRDVINDLGFSPDGKVLASGSSDGTVRFWDVTAGKEVGRLGAENDPRVASFHFSPDGKALAVWRWAFMGEACYVALWDLRTRRELRRLAVPKGTIPALAFSPDGKVLAWATSATPCHILLWDVRSGKLLARRGERRGPADAVAFFPDGKRLLSVSWGSRRADRPVCVWDVATGKEAWSFRGGGGFFQAVLSPEGKVLATAEEGEKAYTLRLHDPGTGRERHRLTSAGGPFHALVFSPEGKTLVTVERKQGESFTLHLRDAATGRGRHRLTTTGYPYRLTVSPDGKRLVAGSCDDWGFMKMRIWDVQAGKELLPADEHCGGVLVVAYAPDGRLVATAGVYDDTARVWDVTTSRQVCLLSGEARFRALAFCPDGKTLASAGGFEESPIRLWDVRTGKEVRRFGPRGLHVSCLRFAPDGRTLLAAGSGEVWCWEVATGRQCFQLPREPFGLGRLALSPDGKTLIAANRSITLWDLGTRKKFRTIGPPGEPIEVVALSADGRILASGARGGCIRLWEANTGRLLHEIPGSTAWPHFSVYSLAFSPDGKVLASASSQGGTFIDPTVRLWEVATGKQRHVLRGHRQAVFALAFSPDGRALVSGSGDSTALAWDLRLGAGRRAKHLAPGQIALLWAALAGPAADAYQAQHDLAAEGNRGVAFLGGRLRPIPRPDRRLVARWLEQLDDDDFRVREQATRELAARVEAAEESLRRALQVSPSTEVRQRVRTLLARLRGKEGEWVRTLRAVEVLEHIGTHEARQALRRLANGGPGAWLTQEAKAALRRLTARPTSPP